MKLYAGCVHRQVKHGPHATTWEQKVRAATQPDSAMACSRPSNMITNVIGTAENTKTANPTKGMCGQIT